MAAAEQKITRKGITNADGEFIPFFKKDARKNLSKEAELQIDQWNKAMQRDFPTVDVAYIDMISTMFYLDRERAEAYAKEQMEKEDDDEVVERKEPFKEMASKYNRVYT